MLFGFVNLEPKGVHSLDIIDPIPVRLQGNALIAPVGYVSVGESLCASNR